MNSGREYVNQTSVTLTVPYRISPSALAMWLSTFSNAHPTQFIKHLDWQYQEDYNITVVHVTTTGERWPGQFTDKLGAGFPPAMEELPGMWEASDLEGGESDVMGGNPPKGTR